LLSVGYLFVLPGLAIFFPTEQNLILPVAFAVFINFQQRRGNMSIYKIIELVGTSETSWEEAAKTAVETAGKSLKDLRIADVIKMDMRIEDGKVVAYRTRVNLSFKYDVS